MACCLALVAFLAATRDAGAFDRWSVNRDATNCRACHGDFRAANYVSLVDGQSWGNLHNLHRTTMLGGDCDACHGTSTFPVILDSATGGSGLQGISCMGCHGRSEDAGHDSLSVGRGAGLRQHHTAAGVPSCTGCHTDSTPASYKPVGESIKPPFYANPGTGHPNMPTDPCNRAGKENYAGSPIGQDNDGDGLMDGADPDCKNYSSSADFDGDRKADIAVFRPSNATWYLRSSVDNTVSQIPLGTTGDNVVIGDYDGDGKADIAVFHAATGIWTIRKSSTGTLRTAGWGVPGDIPVPADYDGDGTTDIAVFRPSNGTWYVAKSSGGFTEAKFGSTGDLPVPGDYDYDWKADLAVFRPSNGTWYALKSNGGSVEMKWGASGDIPAAGDYDGDGRTDLALFRPSTGAWYVMKSSGGSVETRFGAQGDVPVAGDFYGTGKTDLGVFRPSNGIWYVLGDNGTETDIPWGVSTDVPLKSGY